MYQNQLVRLPIFPLESNPIKFVRLVEGAIYLFPEDEKLSRQTGSWLSQTINILNHGVVSERTVLLFNSFGITTPTPTEIIDNIMFIHTIEG